MTFKKDLKEVSKSLSAPEKILLDLVCGLFLEVFA